MEESTNDIWIIATEIVIKIISGENQRDFLSDILHKHNLSKTEFNEVITNVYYLLSLEGD